MLEAEAADGGGRRARPGAVPDAALMVDGRRRLYDVKLIHFCRSRYWPSHEVADARGGPLERRAMEVQREYRSGAESLDARTAAHYASSGGQAPEGQPTAVQILESSPPVCGRLWQHGGRRLARGSREVGILIDQAASSAAQRQWRTLGTRSLAEARAWMTSVTRQQVSFAAAFALICRHLHIRHSVPMPGVTFVAVRSSSARARRQ